MYMCIYIHTYIYIYIYLHTYIYTYILYIESVLNPALNHRARIQLLVSDYATGHADGPDAAEWLSRMEESVAKLTKRLGGDRVAELVRMHRNKETKP